MGGINTETYNFGIKEVRVMHLEISLEEVACLPLNFLFIIQYFILPFGFKCTFYIISILFFHHWYFNFYVNYQKSLFSLYTILTKEN